MKKTTSAVSYAQLRRTVYDFKEKYPFAGYSVCARSWGGRALFTLSLGNRQNSALYVGGIGADDSESVQILLSFFDSLCKAYGAREKISGIKVNDIFATKGIAVIPCVNPDGMEIRSSGAVAAGCYAGLAERVSGGDLSRWNANARGVEIGRNFSTGWRSQRQLEKDAGIDSPSPRSYGGKTPESEPETRAMVKMCRSRDVRHIIQLQKGKDEIYMCSGSREPDRAEMMAKILVSSCGYSCAQSVNTHEMRRGLPDWFSDEFGRPAFSVESAGESEAAYERLEEMLVLSAIM